MRMRSFLLVQITVLEDVTPSQEHGLNCAEGLLVNPVAGGLSLPFGVHTH